MGQLLGLSLGVTLECISSNGNVPPLFRYHCKCIFDEGSILNYCLMVHCTKGQVGNVAENGKAGPGTATLGCWDCRSFDAIVVQEVAGRRVRIQRHALS